MDRRIIGLALFAIAALLYATVFVCDALYLAGAAGRGLPPNFWGVYDGGKSWVAVPALISLVAGLIYFIQGEIKA